LQFVAGLVAVFSGTVASPAKQVLSVAPEVHGGPLPHLHDEEVQILDNGAAHCAEVPHMQVPALQVSTSLLQVIELQGSTVT
jgi:hypothetical protein